MDLLGEGCSLLELLVSVQFHSGMFRCKYVSLSTPAGEFFSLLTNNFISLFKSLRTIF